MSSSLSSVNPFHAGYIMHYTPDYSSILFNWPAGLYLLSMYLQVGWKTVNWIYCRTPMARTLMALSPWLARTIIVVPKVNFMHNPVFHPGWLELPLARTIFHCSKPVWVIEVLLYIAFKTPSFISKIFFRDLFFLIFESDFKYIWFLWKNPTPTMNLVVWSADNHCKQFRPRSGSTKCWAWSESKLFDTLIVSWNNFGKRSLEKYHQATFFMPPLFVECGRALSVAHVRPSVCPSVRASVRPSVRPSFR